MDSGGADEPFYTLAFDITCPRHLLALSKAVRRHREIPPSIFSQATELLHRQPRRELVASVSGHTVRTTPALTRCIAHTDRHRLNRLNSCSYQTKTKTTDTMKHLAAYLLLGLGGNTSPSASDVKVRHFGNNA